MPKQILQVTDFSAGLNAYSDAKDIDDNQFAQNWNSVVDKAGVVRVAGAGLDSISTDYHDSTNFQKGYGLFQFDTDYSFSQISGNFNSGVTSGTVSAAASATVFTLEDKPSTSSSNDRYNGMLIFIYSGTRNGESRRVKDYTGSTRVLEVEDAFGGSLDTTSKYIIYNWKLDGTNWSGSAANKDFITDGSDAYYSAIRKDLLDDYYIYSKKSSITDNESSNLGLIEYPANTHDDTTKLTLKPGVQYFLTFNCAAKQKWTNAVANGKVDGGSGGFFDKAPSIALYSTTVSDSSGCVIALGSPSTPGTGWTNGTYYRISQTSTTGAGRDLQVNIVVSGGTTLAFHLTEDKGTNYIDTETLTFADPLGNGSNVTIAVSGVNRSGISLYRDNTWLCNDDQANNLLKTQVSFIDNGDFAEGVPVASPSTDVAWTLVDSTSAFTLSELAANGYDGDDGTLQIQADNNFDSAPTSYIKQTMTLHDLTSYHLNFLYDSSEGIQYAVYDTTTGVDDYIIPWRALPPTRVLSASSNYRYANSMYDERFIDNDLNASVDYILFDVSKSPIAATSNVEIRLAPTQPGGIVKIHGVTVFKALNDLVSMGKLSSSSSSPFGSSINNFSNYSMSFKVPSNYSEVSDWKLLINAGEYGFRNGWSFDDGGASLVSTQEVYIDDLRISSEEGDTITALVDNNANSSNISFYSSKIGSWFKNHISWGNIKAKPVYTFVNGMLKISDANFGNSNSNKLLYYQDSRILDSKIHYGWMVLDSPLPSPPNLYAREGAFDMVNYYEWNAIPFLNEYFKDLYYCQTNQYHVVSEFIELDDDGDNIGDVTNITYSRTSNPEYEGSAWPLDAFGDYYERDLQTGDYLGDVTQSGSGGTVKSKWNGLIIANRSYIKANNAEPSSISAYRINGSPDSSKYPTRAMNENSDVPFHTNVNETYLLNTNNIQFKNQFDDGFTNSPADSESFEDIQTDKMCVATGGCKSTGTEWSNTNCYWESGTQEVGDSDNGVRNPITFIIDGGDIESHLSLVRNAPQTTGSISEIKFSLEYLNMKKTSPWDGCYSPPYFEVKVGKAHPSMTASSARMFQTSQVLRDDTIVKDFWGYDDNGNEIKKEFIIGKIDATNPGWGVPNGSYKEGSSMTTIHGAGHQSRQGTNSEMLSGFEYGYWGNPVAAAPAKLKISFEFSVHFDVGELKKTDGIKIQFWEHLNGNGRHGGDNGPLMGQKVDGSTGYGDAVGKAIMGPYVPERAGSHRRLKVKNLDFKLYNDAEEGVAASESLSEAQLDYIFGEPSDVSASGWGGRMFEAASSSVNVFGEESSLSISKNPIGAHNGESNIEIGHSPSISLSLSDSYINKPNVAKTNFYMRDSESDIFYLQFYVNHKTLTLNSTVSNKKVAGQYSVSKRRTTWFLSREHFKVFNQVNSYESETMVSQEDAMSMDTMTARYKTAVVANNRLYAGNVFQGGVIYGDRMLKSPIAKYNILPASNFIDVAINDGDEITALSYYKDKILQFKKKKVFVINVAGDFEFLEDTFENVGIQQDCQVVTTPHGIAWANRYGCHLYDGQNMTNLIDNIIPETEDYTSIAHNYWYASNSTLDGICSIGYVENRDTLLVKFTVDSHEDLSNPGGVSYHFPTKSWAFLNRAFSGNSLQSRTGIISNMISDTNGDILYYRFNSGDALANNQIKKWNNNPSDNGGVKVFYFTTKDFTFGDVSTRKKIYKVYITYKTNSNSKVFVLAGTNSLAVSSMTDPFDDNKCKFQGTSTACYDATTNGLLSTGSAWKTAEMRFTTASNFNNIYSMQLQFRGLATPTDHEINDISIIYRTKSVK